MCPHGYHHSGFMVTPALGTGDNKLDNKLDTFYNCIDKFVQLELNIPAQCNTFYVFFFFFFFLNWRQHSFFSLVATKHLKA